MKPYSLQTNMPRDSIKSRTFQWGEMSKIVEWLSQVMAEKNLSQADLARLLGVERQTVYKVLTGKRRLNSDELLKLQVELGISPPLTHSPSIHVGYVKVVGEVAGGLWKDVTYSDFVEYEIPIVHDPRWPEEALKALVVRGESINRRARDGDIVLTLALKFAPRSFAAGDWVIAERQRGDLIETTVKRIERDDAGNWILLPDSDDPRFQDPMRLEEDGVESVRVVAFVLEFIKPATRL